MGEKMTIIAYPYKIEQDFYTVFNEEGREEERSYIRIWAKDIFNKDIIIKVKKFHPYLYVKGGFNLNRIKNYIDEDTFMRINEMNEKEKSFFFAVINAIPKLEEVNIRKAFIQAYYEQYIAPSSLKTEDAIIDMLKHGIGEPIILLRKLSLLRNKRYAEDVVKTHNLRVPDDWGEKIKDISESKAESYPVLTIKDFRKIKRLYIEYGKLVQSYLANIIVSQYIRKEIVDKKEFITSSIFYKIFSGDTLPSKGEIHKIIVEELKEYKASEEQIKRIEAIINELIDMIGEPKSFNMPEKYSVMAFRQHFEDLKKFYEEIGLFDKVKKLQELLLEFSNELMKLTNQKFTKIYFKSTKKFRLIRSALKLFGYDVREDNIQFELRYMVDSKIQFTWNKFWVYRVKSKRNEIPVYYLDDYNTFEPLTEYEIKLYNLPEQPEFKALYFDIEVYNKHTMNIGEAPIIAIGTLLVTYYESKPVLGEYKVFYNLDAMNEHNEKELLRQFFEYIKKNNVDMIIGYNSNQYDIPFIIKRAEKLKVSTKISKINTPPSERVRIKEAREGQAFSMEYTGWSIDGIIVIDALRLAERDIVGMQRYNLKDLADELGLLTREERVIIKGSELWKAWEEMPELVLQYLENDVMATYLIYEKTLRELQEELVKLLNKDLQYIVFIKTSKLVESRILDKAMEENYIMPRKKSEKGGYSGALVLPPITGKLIGVSVDDYASLYPNLIITYNISLETFIGHVSMNWVWKWLNYKPDSFIEYFILEHMFYKLGLSFIIYYDVKGDDYEEVKTAYQRAKSVYLFRLDIPGFISEAVKQILKRRLEVKKLMKQTTDEQLKQKLNIEQLGLKKLANSFYGYLGYVHSLVFRTEIAEAITSAGRMTNYHTVMTAISSGLLKPVYGDTDSSMFISTMSSEQLAEVLPDEFDLDEWVDKNFEPTFELFEWINSMINENLSIKEEKS